MHPGLADLQNSFVLIPVQPGSYFFNIDLNLKKKKNLVSLLKYREGGGEYTLRWGRTLVCVARNNTCKWQIIDALLAKAKNA